MNSVVCLAAQSSDQGLTSPEVAMAPSGKLHNWMAEHVHASVASIPLSTEYRDLQVGWNKFATKIRVYAHFWWGF